MNKTQLADQLAEAHDLKKADAIDILNTILGAITASVAAGEDVALQGFGAFRKVHKPARTARNPQTGEAIQVEGQGRPEVRPRGRVRGRRQEQPRDRRRLTAMVKRLDPQPTTPVRIPARPPRPR